MDHEFSSFAKFSLNITGKQAGSDKKYQYFESLAPTEQTKNDKPVLKKTYYQVKGIKLNDIQ